MTARESCRERELEREGVRQGERDDVLVLVNFSVSVFLIGANFGDGSGF